MYTSFHHLIRIRGSPTGILGSQEYGLYCPANMPSSYDKPFSGKEKTKQNVKQLVSKFLSKPLIAQNYMIIRALTT